MGLKPVIAAQAKESQGTRTDICQKSDRSSIDTKKELAKVAGVSHDTIHKVETIEAKATPQTKQLVREGKLSINQATAFTTSMCMTGTLARAGRPVFFYAAVSGKKIPVRSEACAPHRTGGGWVKF